MDQNDGEVTTMEKWEESLSSLVFKLYGFKCKRIRRLNGYDDLNFHVMVQDAENSYIIKILSTSNSNDTEFINEYIAVLLHLQKENIICPYPIMNKELKYQNYATDWEEDGEMEGIFREMNQRIIMLHEYHDAELLLNVKLTEKLCYELGVYISELHRKMMKFNKSSVLRHKSITGVWSLENMPLVSKYLHFVQNNEDREVANKIIQQFKERVVRNIPNLESGALHGDVNDQNILVKRKGAEWSIYGMIDFSDMIHSCYLFELAISVTYLWLRDPSNKSNGIVFLAPYRPLTCLEYDLFKTCICARLVQSMVLGLKAYDENPENKYVLDTQSGWPLLRQLYDQDDKEFAHWLKHNIELYRKKEIN